jgi:pyruvate dehydrogenase (quinone)
MIVEGIPEFETDHDRVDYAAIASAVGIPSTRVERPQDVRGALTDALSRPGPALVDVVTDPNALSIPPDISEPQVKGFMLAAGRTVLSGGVGRMIDLARANLRNIPRP